MTHQSHVLAATSSIQPSVLAKVSGADAAANVGIISTLSDPGQQLLLKRAFAWSIRNMWIFYTCVGAVGAAASIFIEASVLSEEHTETRTGLRKKETVQDDTVELRER